MNGCLRMGVCWGLAVAVRLACGAEGFSLDDFSQRMEAYGVPNLSSAIYVSARCWNMKIETDLPYGLKLAGNAWLLAETRNSEGQPVKGTFLVNGGDIFEMEWDWRSPGYRRLETEAVLAAPKSKFIGLTGIWRKVTPLWDERKCMAYLKSIEAEPSYPSLKHDADARGCLALLAGGWWQRGKSTSAGELWAELSKWSGPSNTLAGDAKQGVADGQYESLYRRFCADGNWQAYGNGIRGLLERFSEEWSTAPAMRELFRRVEERIGTEAPVPKATNGWTHVDMEQAARMLDLHVVRENPNSRVGSPVLWMIPSSWRDRAPMPLDVELEIYARGVDAIPFLLALADDGALTGVDHRAILHSSFVFRDRSQAMKFENLNRPATRGEVALFWLQELMPESVVMGEYRLKEGAQLKAAVHAVYQRYAGCSDEELAVQLLPEDYGEFNSSAVRFLLDRARKSAVPALEAFLIAEPSEAQAHGYWKEVRYKKRMELATKYAAFRGESARLFLTALSSQLREEVRKGGIPKGVDAEADAASLENRLDPLTAEQVLAASRPRDYVSRGREEAICEAQLHALSGEERSRLLLVHAGDSTNVNVRIMLVQLLTSCVFLIRF